MREIGDASEDKIAESENAKLSEVLKMSRSLDLLRQLGGNV